MGGYDIIILAVIAGFLIFWLYSVLGRRTGHERPPEDAFSQRRDTQSEGNVVELPDRGHRTDNPDHAAPSVESDDPIAAGLTQIQIADSSFTKDTFLQGARSAFEMIVHAFATGDNSTLRNLLDDQVYDNFAAAIKARITAKETLETSVISIRSADIVDARMDGRNAMVTVKIVSDQVNATRDEEGRVIDGDPNYVDQITDIWTFSRNTRSRDPNWKLVETRSPN